MSENSIRLTQYSHGAGCGCKISPKVLETILHSEQAKFVDPNLLVGNETRDDAAVYDLGNGTSVISTTDFFMPIVDNPFDFGRIADLCRHFRIPLAVIINKADLNAEESAAITAQCAADGHTLLGTLPFDPLVTEVMVRRQALTESHNPLGDRLKDMWSALQDLRVSR